MEEENSIDELSDEDIKWICDCCLSVDKSDEELLDVLEDCNPIQCGLIMDHIRVVPEGSLFGYSTCDNNDDVYLMFNSEGGELVDGDCVIVLRKKEADDE